VGPVQTSAKNVPAGANCLGPQVARPNHAVSTVGPVAMERYTLT